MSKKYLVWRKEPYGQWEKLPHKPAVLSVATITAQHAQLAGSEVKIGVFLAEVNPNKEGH